MSEISSMQQWLQSCFTVLGGGTVTLEHCDGVPGNGALYYLGTEERQRSQDLRGSLLVRYRCHYQLRYFSRDGGVQWLRQLQDRMTQLCAMCQGPELSRIVDSIAITAAGARRVKVLPDGTGEYSMEIYGSYEQYYEEERGA